MFGKYKISTQMLMGYSIALTMLLFITIIVYLNVSRVLETYEWVDRTHRIIEHAYELQHLVSEMENGERCFTILGDSDCLESYHNSITKFDQDSTTLFKKISHNPEQIARLKQFCNEVKKWQQDIAKPIIEKRKEINHLQEQAIFEQITKMTASKKKFIHNHDIHALFNAFVDVENAFMNIREKEAITNVQHTINFMLFGTLFSIVLGLIIAYFLSKSIANPINKIVLILQRIVKGELDVYSNYESCLPVDRIKANNEMGNLTLVSRELADFIKEMTQTANCIADGDFSVQVNERGPYDILSRSMNQLISNFKSVITQANRIAQGDLSIEVSVQSDRDVLGNTLNIMTLALRKSKEENQVQYWLKTGQTQLNDAIRGELDLPELCVRIISFVANYLDCQIGAMYIMNSQENVLQLISSYAFERRKHISNQYAPGEGLVGQAVLEKQPIIVKNVPDDYIHISSGLGSNLPSTILVYPLILDNMVKGVIELGCFSPISNTDMEFMKSIAEPMAIAIHSAQSRSRLQALLKTTQQQSEQLQEQQEELRQSNEELEERSQILQESQARLQTQQEEMEVQQEELRQTNEILEQQKSQLEKQKSSIEEKNIELERAQLIIQEKIKEVESASRYKSEFMANMSHELRTPLNSIILLSRLLADNKYGNLTEKQTRFADTVHSCGNDLLDLINDILDLAKVESGKMELHPQTVHIKMIAKRMEQLFTQSATEQKLQFEISVDETIPLHIHTDQQKAEQVIKNLLSNAFKFTSTGKVRLQIVWASKVATIPTHMDPNQTIAIQIVDTGEGILDENKSLVFEAFRQADGTNKRKHGGTGLGLSIARELARILGGDILFNSKFGEGSTFTFFLPLKYQGITLVDRKALKTSDDKTIPETILSPPQLDTQEKIAVHKTRENEQESPNETSNAPKHTAEKTLLIIEDDQPFAMYLNEMAIEKGFETMIAADGETGLEYAQEFNPDAIFLDVMLPGMDGWMVLEKLKSNDSLRHIPVHFITCATPERQKEALKKGAIGYLNKPIDQQTLDNTFQHIEMHISKSIKNLLVAINDKAMSMSIVESIDNENVLTASVANAKEAYEMLSSATFDCFILDVDLPDMSGIQLLEKIRKNSDIKQIPVIIYSNKPLSEAETNALEDYAQCIIINESSSESFDRLMDESMLFLHQVKTQSCKPVAVKEYQNHDRDAVFQDKTILMVDDDMRNVFAVSSVLDEKGINIIVAENGREALKKLEQHDNIDLIIMDMMMPEMDGYETMRAIRKIKKFQEIIILALTAKAMRGDRDKCIEAGANDYMSKPVEPDKLLSMLRVWLYK
jgi:CheY-like chemotaxis protein/CHASE3 domain sensor protein/putative methionine-R-sulfoxide reductase with GAF domain